jgi:hypothetical protein
MDTNMNKEELPIPFQSLLDVFHGRVDYSGVTNMSAFEDFYYQHLKRFMHTCDDFTGLNSLVTKFIEGEATILTDADITDITESIAYIDKMMDEDLNHCHFMYIESYVCSFIVFYDVYFKCFRILSDLADREFLIELNSWNRQLPQSLQSASKSTKEQVIDLLIHYWIEFHISDPFDLNQERQPMIEYIAAEFDHTENTSGDIMEAFLDTFDVPKDFLLIDDVSKLYYVIIYQLIMDRQFPNIEAISAGIYGMMPMDMVRLEPESIEPSRSKAIKDFERNLQNFLYGPHAMLMSSYPMIRKQP